MKIIASGIPETLEQYQLALNAAWAGGRAYGQGEAKLEQTPLIALGLHELYEFQEATGFDTASEFKAAQQEPLCDDEGCPHHGTKHICITASPQPAQRKPLPSYEIVTMYDERPTSDSDMIEFARAIEHAHGIY